MMLSNTLYHIGLEFNSGDVEVDWVRFEPLPEWRCHPKKPHFSLSILAKDEQGWNKKTLIAHIVAKSSKRKLSKGTQSAELPWGLLATFSDPDGNNFSLLQPPAK